MSAIYLFSEALSTHQICAIHRLGPGYKVSAFFLYLFIMGIFFDWGWSVIKRIYIILRPETSNAACIFYSPQYLIVWVHYLYAFFELKYANTCTSQTNYLALLDALISTLRSLISFKSNMWIFSLFWKNPYMPHISVVEYVNKTNRTE